MDALGVSDRKLCELIDVSQPAVSRWRSGARLPRRYATEDNQIRDPVVTIARALTKLSGTKVTRPTSGPVPNRDPIQQSPF